MIQIEDAPTRTACATCGPLTWLYSSRRRAWVAFIPAPGEHTLRPHPCRFAQDPATWREVRQSDPPSAAYLAAKVALKERTGEHPTADPEHGSACTHHLAKEAS